MDDGYHEIDIAAAFSRYTEEVQKKIRKAARNIGNEMLEEIVSGSPVRQIPPRRRTPPGVNPGEYKQSWIKTVKNSGTGIRVIVRNKKYQLVHLQELPHKTGAEGRNRGTYPAGGQNDAIGLVRAANKKYSDKLNDEIARILEE